MLGALMVVWAADTGAYFSGRKFGRHKLAPKISPNKTVEGLVGGMLLAVILGVVLSLFAGATTAQLPAVAAVSLSAALFSVVGDLFESLLKRSEEHTSELQSLMRTSSAVLCLQKKRTNQLPI